MIELKIRDKLIHMEGHAGYHEAGRDIVCAGISALTCNLVIAMRDLTQNRIRADTKSGKMEITWDELDDKGKLLIDAWFIGISAINEEYQCIKFL